MMYYLCIVDLIKFNHSSKIVYSKIDTALIEALYDTIEFYLPIIIGIKHILWGRVISVCIHDVMLPY